MAQASSKNPYRPGVGVRPLYLAGRDPALRRFDAMLRAAPEQQASMRVAGLRGVGKTVLLGAFGERAEEANWEPADLEFQPSHNTDEALQDALGGLLSRARARLSRLERLRAAAGRAIKAGALSLTWEDVSLSIAPGSDRENDLAKDIFETVELAVAKGRKGLVLLLDEAQLIRDERGRHGEHPLSLLIAPVVALQRQELPLALVVGGLPTLAANLQKARSYSERLFRGRMSILSRPTRRSRHLPDRSKGPGARPTTLCPPMWSRRSKAIRTSFSYGVRAVGRRRPRRGRSLHPRAASRGAPADLRTSRPGFLRAPNIDPDSGRAMCCSPQPHAPIRPFALRI